MPTHAGTRRWLTLAFVLACSKDEPTQQRPSGDSEVAPSDDSASVVDLDGDGSPAEDDCDDDDPAVHPEASELCNGIDDNCDGVVDTDATDAVIRHLDADGDGYGGNPFTTCEPTDGIAEGGDCDDANAAVNPLACDDPYDGVDNDCNGTGDTERPVTYRFTQAQGQDSRFQTATAGPTALRVVGTRSSARGEVETRRVHFDSTKSSVLALASSGPLAWEVDEAIAGTLVEILVVSDDDATVLGPKGTPITYYTGAALAEFELDWNAPETRLMESALVDATGIAVTSWVTQVDFRQLTIEDGTEWSTDALEYPNPVCPGDDTPFGEPDTTALPADCQELVDRGGTVCLTTARDSTVLFTLDGDSCEVLPTGIDAYTMDQSVAIAWRGEHVYGCGDGTDYQLFRIRLTDGAVDRSYRYCRGVVDAGDQLLAQDPGWGGSQPLRPFTSWAEVVSGEMAPGVPGGNDTTAIAARADVLYVAPFYGDTIRSHALTKPFDEYADIVLEENDYRSAFDVTDDNRIVMRGRLGWPTANTSVLDMDGTTLATFELPDDTAGVSCFTP